MTQGALITGIIGVVALFYFIQNWRVIFWVSIIFPLAVSYFLTVFFFTETPQYLIRLYSVEYIRKQLLFIAALNGRK